MIFQLARAEYVQTFKRRRVGKTDYHRRRGLVVGKRPVFVLRVTNKYVYGQIFQLSPNGDLTLCSVSSKELLKSYAWKGSCKNLPAAYLAGYLLGKKAVAKNISEAVVYTGVNRFVHGSRIASAICGAKDAGLSLAVDKEALPKGDRINGGHIAAFAKKLEVEDVDAYERIFSRAKAAGLDLSDYPKHFEEVKGALSRISSE